MIVVTGTKRSGTSMWMQVLIGAGLPHIGEAFPRRWAESIGSANPNGFFESGLRQGIFYATNPHPKTGTYLRAEDTTRHVVKVFIPGVVRTERAYLDRVVGTLRHWRVYARSIEALYADEDAWLAENPGDHPTGEQAVAAARAKRPAMPTPVEWFLENYELLRDFAVRRYPINLVSYESFVEAPEPVLHKVIGWLGQGELEGALAAVNPDLHRSADRPAVASELAVDEATARVFDDLWATVHETSSIPQTLLPDLNSTWRTLQRAWGSLERDRGLRDSPRAG